MPSLNSDRNQSAWLGWKSWVSCRYLVFIEMISWYWSRTSQQITAADVASQLYLYNALTSFLFLSLRRPTCLTSKCMRTSLPSLHPPPSGAAVRGFAAAASCYDVKTTTPLFLPSCPSYTLPAARRLTPDLLSPSRPPVTEYMLWCVCPPPSPLWSCRERERAK